MALIGLGVGMMMQNLVLAVQNVVAREDLGSASSFIAFTRTLGGAIGVSALGAVLSHRVGTHLATGLAQAGIPASALGGGSSTGIPDVRALPAQVRPVVESAYGSSIADIFLIAAPFALVALLFTFFFKEVALRGSASTAAAAAEDAVTAVPADVGAGLPTGGTDTAGTSTTGSASRGRGAHASGAHANGTVNGTARAGLDQQAPPADAPVTLPTQSSRSDAGLTVSGVVRHHDGRVLAGAVVTLADQTGQQVARTSSDDEGGYLLALPTGGTYLLIVAAAHVQPSATLVPVGSTSVRQDVVLAGRAAVTGQVGSRDAVSGAMVPVPGALVTLTDITGQVIGFTRTDGNGGYAFAQLMGGTYVLTAQSDAHRPLARSVEVPDTGSLTCDLQLTGGGRLTGTVIAASDGRRVREASVTLVDAEGDVVAAAVTDEDGTYSFEDLAGGHYTLTAAGYAPVATSVDVEEDTVAAAQLELGSPRS